MNRVTVIEVLPNPSKQSMAATRLLYDRAPVTFRCISEDEQQDKDRLAKEHHAAMDSGVNLKFIVVPNGVFLPCLKTQWT